MDGAVDTKLLEVRVFAEATKKTVFKPQSFAAVIEKTYNCPLCVLGHDANKTKLYSMNEMDADHLAAWSKGGATAVTNCQMLCKTHNRAKGNK